MEIIIKDKDGDQLCIADSEDFLCYIEVPNLIFGVSPEHAKVIINALTGLLSD